MDNLRESALEIALSALSPYDFALAGSGSLDIHGFIDRPSNDLDIFTIQQDEQRFSEAVDEFVKAAESEEWKVAFTIRDELFAKALMTSPRGNVIKIDLGCDYRRYPPFVIALGSVIDPRDAVANKTCATFGRSVPRDVFDLDAIRLSNRYTDHELFEMASDHDPGFDPYELGISIQRTLRLNGYPQFIKEIPNLTQDEYIALVNRMDRWSRQLTGNPLEERHRSAFTSISTTENPFPNQKCNQIVHSSGLPCFLYLGHDGVCRSR